MDTTTADCNFRRLEKFAKIAKWPSVICAFIFFTSCEDFVHIEPPATQLVKETVFEDDLTATSAVVRMYIQMSGTSGIAGGSLNGVAFLGGMSADELLTPTLGSEVHQFNENAISPNNTYVAALWSSGYKYIYLANATIDGLEKSDKINADLKNQLLGEAKFVRALSHFYLTNMFGDIPYVNSTDYRSNTTAIRQPKEIVYEHIKQDLLDAQNLLADDYRFSKNERGRPNKWAAMAFLARVYLYARDWTNAEIQSTLVINNTALYNINSDLNKVFLKNSSEAIWQIVPTSTNKYTNEGNIFVQPAALTYGAISQSLYSAFEVNDKRRTSWIAIGTNGASSWYYPFKYKERSANGTGAEYSMVFRLAEQYLIRAEARAMQGKVVEAAFDVNVIRNRAGLLNTSATTQSDLIDAILIERRLELFTEWGHRWFDLQRTSAAGIKLGSIKPNWSETDVLYPVPQSEIFANPNLSQNDGY